MTILCLILYLNLCFIVNLMPSTAREQLSRTTFYVLLLAFLIIVCICTWSVVCLSC